MIGSLVGMGLSAVGSIFGGIKASEAMKKVKRGIEARKSENASWYDRRYNEDVTQRADAQRILSKTEESIRNRNREAAGVQAVTGGTDESVAAAKEANNAALSEAASRIAVNGEARKDRIEDEYRRRDAQYDSQLDSMEANRARNVANAEKGVSQAAGSIGESLDGFFDVDKNQG